MVILALDTSTRTGSLAIWRDGTLRHAEVGDPARMHAVRLPDVLVGALAAEGLTLTDVERFAVLSGPGGFTGLRVGLATVQGLAYALEREVVVVSTLEALAWAAHTASPDHPVAGAWMHGMRGEVFTALYRPAAAPSPSGLAAILDPSVDTPAGAAALWPDRIGHQSVAVGGDAREGAAGDALRAAVPAAQLAWTSMPPLAGVLAALAAHPAARPVPAAAVAPTYVRRPDAVVAREQASLGVPDTP